MSQISRWTFPGLATEAEKAGLRISWEVMQPGFSGAVDVVSGTIFLDQHLDSRPRYALSVLAHELGHYTLGHTCAQSIHGERLADEWAARLLIPVSDYRLAETLHGNNNYYLARELGVTHKIIEAYQRSLTTR